MEINLQIQQDDEPPIDWVESVETLHQVLLAEVGDLDVPPIDLTVVLTADMTSSVRRRSRNEQTFQSERLGGNVAGKTLAINRDYSVVEILIACSESWANDGLSRTYQFLDFMNTLGH